MWVFMNQLSVSTFKGFTTECLNAKINSHLATISLRLRKKQVPTDNEDSQITLIISDPGRLVTLEVKLRTEVLTSQRLFIVLERQYLKVASNTALEYDLR